MEKGITLTQETDLPMTEKVTFRIEADSTANLCDGAPVATDAVCGKFSLALRIPDWLAEPPRVSLNGADATCRAENGYLVISREWADGDLVELSLPAKIVPHTLPDNADHVFAFKFGPVVLAAELGTEKKYLYQIGVMCDVAGNKYIRGQQMTLTGNYGSTSGIKTLPSETIRVKDSSVADFMRDINEHLHRIPGTLRFVLNDTELDDEKEPLVFVPYYLINEKRYGIYWLFADASSAVAGTDATRDGNETHDMRESATPDRAAHSPDPLSNSTLLQSIGVGYGTQTEGSKDLFPFMQETGAGSVGNPDELTRFAKAGGSFSYMMKVAPGKQNFLVCTLLKADDGKTLRITAGEKTIASFTLDSRRQRVTCDGEKYTRIFELPQEVVEQAVSDTIRIEFSGATETTQSARIAAPLEIRCVP